MFINTQYLDKQGVVKITLNGPRHNLLNFLLIRELSQQLDIIEAEFPNYGAIVITGSSISFSTGADINEFDAKDVNAYLQNYDKLSSFFHSRLPHYSIPIIAAVDGYCFGGGFELLMSCDIILVSSNLKLGLPELTLGLIPGFGGTQRLTHIVGKTRAMELILISRTISGIQLYQLGIANHCFDSYEELQEAALKMATKISSGYRYANKSARLSINYSMANIEQGSSNEAALFKKQFINDDKKKGVAKFLSKYKKKIDSKL